MLKKVFFLVFCILFVCATSVCAQDTADNNSDKLFAPSISQKFYEIAYELANAEASGEQQIKQAMVLLTAARNLDKTTSYILPDMIRLASRSTEQNNQAMVYRSLNDYVDKSADLEVATKAVRYLLEQLDSREQREELLKMMLRDLGNKNAVLDSELATLLGLLMVEKADFKNATFFLMQAYSKNKYNRLAFSKLAELVPEQIKPTMYLEHQKLLLAENPLDIETGMAFAQYAKQLQLYDIAADAYGYCVNLFSFLYPSQELPSYLYIPWAICNYNTQRNLHKCIEIAANVRQGGRFDLFLETIAGKAAAKIGNTEQANLMLEATQAELQKLINENALSQEGGIGAQQIAWFYCFGLPDPNRALDWANKAYSIEPDSPIIAGILAYALVMNGQTDWAKSIIDNYEMSTISALTLAQIQLAEEQQSSAIETLKGVITRDPGSLEAELAKEILAKHGGEYVPPVDTDIILGTLKNSFGQTIVPTFVNPDTIISIQLSTRGSKFSYGSEFGGSLVITNNSSQPLIISDDGLFTGNIRIDADVSGDLNEKIPELVSFKIRPSLPVEPGKSIAVPLRLDTGRLRNILLSYPQASLDIKFTAFIDPVIDDQNNLTSRIRSIKPASMVVKRPSVEITSRYLQNRLNSLSKGWQGQKIKIAQLFVGLLMEQQAMAGREPLYRFMYADWMPDLLKSALLHNLADDDWIVKVHTMAAILSLPLDYELIDAAAEGLNDTNWPVRLMAISLLAKNQDSNFNKVLDWTAQYDSNALVRDMAVALGATKPQPQEPVNPEPADK